MSTAAASDVLNKTWTRESEDDDIDDQNGNEDQYSSTTRISTAKLNLNETQVIVVPKKMNITANYGECTNAADTSEFYSYSKSSKYSSLPVIISTNSNQFAKASNEIKSFMERFCVNDCYESIFDERFENIDLE